VVSVTNSAAIDCAIAGETLTCQALGDAAVLAAGGGRLSVVLPVVPEAPGTLTNWRKRGSCVTVQLFGVFGGGGLRGQEIVEQLDSWYSIGFQREQIHLNRIANRWVSEIPFQLQDPLLQEGVHDVAGYVWTHEASRDLDSRRIDSICTLKQAPAVVYPVDQRTLHLNVSSPALTWTDSGAPHFPFLKRVGPYGPMAAGLF
jgi:hypothetical protein